MSVNVEDRGAKGDCTPLMDAASAGYGDVVRLLYANGADVNAKSSAGMLSCTVYFRRPFLIEFIIVTVFDIYFGGLQLYSILQFIFI